MSRYSPGTPETYIEVHESLKKQYGSARSHACRCGEPAAEWAYQYTGEGEMRDDDGRRPHTTDLADYAPMCRSCHVRFDLEHDPVFAEALLTSLSHNAREIAALRRADPVLYEEMVERGRKMGTLRGERMKTDPAFAEQQREGSRRGAMTFLERMRTDLDFRERISASRRANALKRRRCLECGFVSNAAGIGTHQKHTGHEGWDES